MAVQAPAAPLSSPPSKPQPKHSPVATPAWKISPEKLAALQRFMEQLRLKAYGPSTIRTYRNEFLQLLRVLKAKPAAALTSNELRRYFVYCFEKLKLSENTLHSRINAIKFYYEQVLKREKFFWEIPRSKKAIQNPRFFSQEEVAAIIWSTGCKKLKTSGRVLIYRIERSGCRRITGSTGVLQKIR